MYRMVFERDESRYTLAEKYKNFTYNKGTMIITLACLLLLNFREKKTDKKIMRRRKNN